MRRTFALLAVAMLAALVPGEAAAHAEREAEFPDGSGSVPVYRPMIAEPNLVVCKRNSGRLIRSIGDDQLRRVNQKLLERCDFRHLQDAVNAVKQRGTTIYLLPGTYRERPYRGLPKCAEALSEEILTYEEQLKCPHAQNLVGIFGDSKPGDDKRRCDAAVCDLQIEGTGDDAEDVLFVGGFDKKGDWAKIHGIRGDRADGLYLKNFTIELFHGNSVYILETDGFVIDGLVGRYNDEYGFLTFAVDHGLYKNCEAHHNGDGGVYPGSASDRNSESSKTGPLKRWAVEITGCSAHHNMLGLSGTAGNSLYVHDNRFFKNATGVDLDSVFPNHPGLPQDHSWFEDNLIYSNNTNFYEKYLYSGKCDKKPAKAGYENGTVCPAFLVPVGTGVLFAGGNHNYMHENLVYDNWRNGFMTFGVPGVIREDPNPAHQFDTSNFNFFVENLMGVAPDGTKLPNGVDFWWDDQGEGNCWAGNESGSGEVTSNTMYPGGLPDCESGGSMFVPVNPYKQGPLVPCATYDRSDPILRQPPGCDWYESPEKP